MAAMEELAEENLPQAAQMPLFVQGRCMRARNGRIMVQEIKLLFKVPYLMLKG